MISSLLTPTDLSLSCITFGIPTPTSMKVNPILLLVEPISINPAPHFVTWRMNATTQSNAKSVLSATLDFIKHIVLSFRNSLVISDFFQFTFIVLK